MNDGRSDGRVPTPEARRRGPGRRSWDRNDRSHPRAGPWLRPGDAPSAGPSPPSSRAWPTSSSWRLVIYLTYFFTMFFSTRPPAPAPVPESDQGRRQEDRGTPGRGAPAPDDATVR